MKILLLDLNFTLVSNSDVKKSPFIKQLENETYRDWLLDDIKKEFDRVILITARPPKYQADTILSIKEKSGYDIKESYFNEIGSFPNASKEHILNKYLFKDKEFVDALNRGDVIAYESNPKTRAMYKKYDITSKKISCEMIVDV